MSSSFIEPKSEDIKQDEKIFTKNYRIIKFLRNDKITTYICSNGYSTSIHKVFSIPNHLMQETIERVTS